MAEPLVASTATPAVRWAKLIDHSVCIGCHACTTACKSENEVPVGVTRTYVKYVETGRFPEARRNFQVTRCNQCANAPCATAYWIASWMTGAGGPVRPMLMFSTFAPLSTA